MYGSGDRNVMTLKDDIWSAAIREISGSGEVTIESLDVDDADTAQEVLEEMEERGWLVRSSDDEPWIPGDVAIDHLDLWEGTEFVIGE